MHKRALVLLDQPGVRETSHIDALLETFHVPLVGLSDALRLELSTESELSEQLSDAMTLGRLPDALVLDAVMSRLRKDDLAEGFMLAGFPGTLAQAEALDHRLGSEGRKLDAAVVLEGIDEDVVRQISSRRVCLRCGHIYDFSNAPSSPEECDRDGSPLVQQEEDRASAIRARIASRRRLAEPLIEYYKGKGTLLTISGSP